MASLGNLSIALRPMHASRADNFQTRLKWQALDICLCSGPDDAHIQGRRLGTLPVPPRQLHDPEQVNDKRVPHVGFFPRPYPSLRSTNPRAGTPYYWAPEVLTGRYKKEADLYSLGVILFELITKRKPNESEGALKLVVASDHRPIGKNYHIICRMIYMMSLLNFVYN